MKSPSLLFAVLCFSCLLPRLGLAEQSGRSEPKSDDKAANATERRMEAEVNLPAAHRPLKSIDGSKLSKMETEKKFGALSAGQSKILRSPIVHGPSPTRAGEPRPPKAHDITELDSLARTQGKEHAKKMTELDSLARTQDKEHAGSMTKLDSLAQTQDKERQRGSLGSSNGGNGATASSRPMLSLVQSSTLAKPVVTSSPEIALRDSSILSKQATGNTAIWTRNDAVPHRGPGPAFIGGTANVKNNALNGTGMKSHP